MHTLTQEYKMVGDSAYWGDYGDWLLFLAVHRDSDLVARSNWEVAISALETFDDWHIERFSHWAVGWVDYLVVKPGGDAEALANEMLAQLENYPVLDDEKLSELEWDEGNKCWQSLSLSNRIELCNRYGISIFAARRDYLPQDDSGDLLDALTE